MENVSETEKMLLAISSMLEEVDDPTLVANVAIGAIMVLVKRLMCGDKEDERS